MIELSDGRIIAAAMGRRHYHWVLCRFEPCSGDVRWQLVGSRAEVPVLGTSLVTILEVVLDGDDPARLQLGWLSELDSSESWASDGE